MIWPEPQTAGSDRRNDMAQAAWKLTQSLVFKWLIINNSKLFVLIFAAGAIVWYGPGLYQMIVPALASIK